MASRAASGCLVKSASRRAIAAAACSRAPESAANRSNILGVARIGSPRAANRWMAAAPSSGPRVERNAPAMRSWETTERPRKRRQNLAKNNVLPETWACGEQGARGGSMTSTYLYRPDPCNKAGSWLAQFWGSVVCPIMTLSNNVIS